ncbi:preprotein translocase, SecE subunit [Coriobacterium glomerans PW2]|uniref:Protein translocase subunit SecE n=1 Tax=Coriobacterium glomerans (strain ATCC 49209 / DSM 20642 / JCM 10262 / PW2) TaxID=700015 RepID=F2N8U1_CORGP|nr:preprotein translocase subunit SecE [Coriobacterium glomerans]AEB07474.1 preprotein translocase, SecE subunit [Coriobacterium glomerans PW2]
MATRKSKRKGSQSKGKASTAVPAGDSTKKAVSGKSVETAAAKYADAKPSKSAKSVKSAKGKSAAKPKSKANAKIAKAKKNKKPNIFVRFKRYIGSIRTEMRRVTWPTKKELINYSIAVCASLVVVGIVIALLDTVIGQGLVLFSGLRG